MHLKFYGRIFLNTITEVYIVSNITGIAIIRNILGSTIDIHILFYKKCMLNMMQCHQWSLKCVGLY